MHYLNFRRYVFRFRGFGTLGALLFSVTTTSALAIPVTPHPPTHRSAGPRHRATSHPHVPKPKNISSHSSRPSIGKNVSATYAAKNFVIAANRGDTSAVLKWARSLDDLVFIVAKDGRTPLHWVVSEGDVTLARQLLSKRADIEAKDKKGNTPLLWAVSNGEIECVRLLQKGANVEAKDNTGQTPLHWAVYYGAKECARVLLGKGANINAKATNGDTPLAVAEWKKKMEVAELLRRYGGTK